MDSGGNIYVFGFKNKKEGYLIYSITPGGKIRWAYHNIEIWNMQLHADMFMNAEGNIYFCKKYELASLDYNGQLRWTAPIDNGFFSPILGDRFGDIYLTGIMKSVYAYNTSGQKIFECAVEPHSQVMIGGAISADGHLYISESTNLYCIR